MKTDFMALAKLRLEEILAFFGFNVQAQVEETERGLELNIDLADSGRLIGYRGENLQALQYLLNQIVQNQAGGRIYLSITISSCKKALAEAFSDQERDQYQ